MHFKENQMLFSCVQKEVEEERQARVGEVSELLGWIKGVQDRAGRSTEPSLAAQQVYYS